MFKVFVLFSCVCMTSGLLQAQNLLSGPETVVFDSVRNRYLVSNMNPPYYIVEIDADGSYSVFSNRTRWTHGMVIVGDVLYVSTNRSTRGGIIGFDLATGEEVFSKLSSSWYFGANGITADTSGSLYLSVGLYSVFRVSLSDGASSLISSSISIPNGLHFDACNNRVLVPSETWSSVLFAVDADDYTVSTIPIAKGRYSCITEDHLHNLYISTFWENQVLRFDSTLGNTAEIIADADGPEGIYFNKLHSTLVIPNLNSNRLSFMPLDIDLWVDVDTTFGRAPFDVNFEGASIYDVTEWMWDFGDGHTASGPSLTHSYQLPGHYNVTLQAVTSTADTLCRTYPHLVACLADTIRAENNNVDPLNDGNIEVNVYVRNNVALEYIVIPITYAGELDLSYMSFSTEGCRTEAFEQQDLIHHDPVAKELVFALKPRASGSPLFMPAGFGSVLKLQFQVDGRSGQETAIVINSTNPAYAPLFDGNGFEFVPGTVEGAVNYPQCCTGTTGNVDYDEGDNTDLSDLTRLIDYLFISFAEPECVEEANIDGDKDALIDLSDLTRLIDYLFISFAPPAECL